MSDGTLEAIERFLTRNMLLTPYLWLDFFGGEPLLCKDMVVRLAEHALGEALENGVRFHSGMTTNAYHLDQVTFHRLHDVGVNHFQITLDGTPEFHDQQRVMASGRGSWERIWGHLLQIQKTTARVKVTLRVHFRAQELEPAIRLMEDYINPTFGRDERFGVQFAEIRRLGGPEDHRIMVMPPLEIEKALRILDGTLLRPNQLIGSGRGDFECYASKPQTLVVKPDGELAKCTVSFEPLGRLGPDGTIQLNEDQAAEWSERASSCPSCPRSVDATPTNAPTKLLSLPLLSSRK
jgi:uncharacterized protein